MNARRRPGRGWLYGTAGVLAAAAFGVGYQARHQAAPASRSATGGPELPGGASAATVVGGIGNADTDIPVNPLPESSPEGVILAQKKRVMGRLRSLEMTRRVATQVRPLVDRAIQQPSIQADLRALAAASGMTLAQYQEYFKGKQEGDLLLESGGDPNARSVADAIGLAQFMVGTGKRCGLQIDIAASNRLSRKINALERQMAWLEQQPATWVGALPPELRKNATQVAASKPAPPPVPQAAVAVAPVTPASTPASGTVADGATSEPAPGGASPAAPSAHAPAEPGENSTLPTASAPLNSAPTAVQSPDVWMRAQWLAYRKDEWQRLVLKRRTVDQRFDPQRAVMAQTQYLVRLTRRYGGVDWALQAYHGGEGGVANTVRLYVSSPAAMVHLASRGAGGSHSGLSYEDLYRGLTPISSPSAFSYLFGRSDDHRYYWWKVLMAERALNLYRKSPAEFEKQWTALKPGISADAVWYPRPDTVQLSDPAALRDAYRSGTLVPLPANAEAIGLRTETLASLEPESAYLHKGLRPEAMGALLRVVHIYRSYGGATPLTAVTLVQSNEYRQKWNQRYPRPPLPPGLPRDPEFHSTGLTFDLQRPTSDWDRKVLEYALGRLYDGLRISWRPETGAGLRKYHVVVNPAYRSEMVDYYRKLVVR